MDIITAFKFANFNYSNQSFHSLIAKFLNMLLLILIYSNVI